MTDQNDPTKPAPPDDATRLITPTPVIAPNDQTMLTPPVSGSGVADSDAQTIALTPSSGASKSGSNVLRPISPSLASGRGTATSAPGARRIGDYELESEIARGGMGLVYRARQLSLNRPVAFKMILSGQFASDADVERFHVEAEAAAGLDHPNIVPIYEVGAFEGNHFFTMKLIDGRSMAHEMPRLVKAPRDGVRLLVKVCRAIHYAHQHSILHRDLKPANILLDSAGEPHVTDFGLAKRTGGDSQLTQTGTIVGTPSYMAPEQAAPSKVPLTTAADVYSLGAMLYEILTGRPPFKGDSPLDTLMLVLNKEAERPRSINQSVDRDLETIALKCLEKDPARRYGSAEALAEDLDRWLEGEPIQARPIGSGERIVKWARRRPAIAALVVAMAAVTLLGVAGVVWQWREAVYQRGQTANALLQVEAEAKAAKAARDQEAAQRQAAQSAQEQEALARKTADEQKAVAVDALAAAQRSAYFNNISLADHEWAGSNIGHVDQLLAAAPAGARNWEWGYLNRLSHNESSRMVVGAKPIVALWLDPKNSNAIVVTRDLSAAIIDLNSGRAVRRVVLTDGSGADIAASSISADGARFAAITIRVDKRVFKYETTVWDTRTGRVLLSQPSTALATPATALALNADGTRLIAAGFDTSGIDPNAPAAELAARLSATSSQLKLWDVDAGKEVRSVGVVSGTVSRIAFSPDVTRLLVTAGPPGGASDTRVLDAATGKPAATFLHADGGIGAISRDGTVVAGGSATAVRVWSATGGEERWQYPAAATSVVALSDNGAYVAAAMADRSIVILDARTGALRGRLFGCTAPVLLIAFAPGDRRLVAADAETVRTFEVPENAARVAAEGPADGLPFVGITPDGRRLVGLGGGILRGWDLVTGRLLYGPRTIAKATELPNTPTALAIANSIAANSGQLVPGQGRMMFSADSGRVALVKMVSTVLDGRSQMRSSIHVLDTTTGREMLTFEPSRDPPGRSPTPVPAAPQPGVGPNVAISLALDGAGMHAALASLAISVTLGSSSTTSAPAQNPGVMFRGSDIEFWDAGGRPPARTLSLDDIIAASVELSPDGQFLTALTAALTGSAGPEYRSYRTATGELIRSIRGDRKEAPIAYARDGSLVAAETPRHTVTVWPLDRSGQAIVLPEHRSAVTRIAFSPDGTRIATLSAEGVTLFDAHSGTQLLMLRESTGPFQVREVIVPGKILSGVTNLTFSSDGGQIVLTDAEPDARGVKVTIKTWNGSAR